MATTTIRLEDALKARVAAATARSGKTGHAFLLGAIAWTVEHAEGEDAVHRLAAARWGNLLATGESVPSEEAKDWLAARANGQAPPRPAARKPQRYSGLRSEVNTAPL